MSQQPPKDFWRERRLLKFYLKDQPYRKEVAQAILAQKPASVLDFGCNVGGTLLHLRALAPDVALQGVDVNPKAVEYGVKNWHLPLVVGDETWLAAQPDDSYDVVYTISVIDHIPDPDPVLEQLARLAPTVILVEPWVGWECDVTEAGLKPNSESWSWDLPKRLRGIGLKVQVRKFPLGTVDMSATYRMYTAHRR